MTARRVALAALLFYVVFVVVKLAANGFDASVFVMAGERYCDPRSTPPSLTVKHEPDGDYGGYDAQFYYRFAIAPARVERTAYGITIDNPPYRHQRILNPALVWLMTIGGHAFLIPWAFLVLDVAAMALVAWLAAKLAEDLGASPAWGLAAAAYPGFLVSVSRDLTEPTSMALALGGMLASRRARPALAAALFTLAILARETTLLVPAGVLGADLLARRWSRVGWGAVPFVAFVGWQIVLTRAWGEVPALANRGSLSPPFVGFARFVADAVAHAYVLDLVQAAFIVAIVVVVARSLFASSAPLGEKLAWLAFALLATTFSLHQYWSDPASYLRVTTELFVLGTLIVAGDAARRASRGPRMIYAGWGALSVLTFVTAAVVR